MKTYTVTVTIAVTKTISAESEDELRELIFNGCTDVDEDLNCADYQIDIVSVEDDED